MNEYQYNAIKCGIPDHMIGGGCTVFRRQGAPRRLFKRCYKQ